ncbi:MAG: efflux RND transporter periplasmic adaptor subunit [Vicinamibacterales bacterium]
MSPEHDPSTPGAPPRAAASSSRLPLIVGAGLVIAVAAGAFWYRAAGRESTDDAQIEGHITPVAARVGGSVLEVLAAENRLVKSGDVLVRLDPRDFEVALAHARAELADAEAALAGATSDLPIVRTSSTNDAERADASTGAAEAAATAAARAIDAATARLEAARARVTEAEARAEQAHRDRDRLRELAGKEEIPAQQFDAAVAAAAVADAAVTSARASVREAETGVAVAESHRAQAESAVRQAQAAARAARTAPQQIDAAEARRAAAEARVAQARAAVRQAELRLEDATVTAPSDGVVSRKSVEPGQIVQPGQPLFALVGLEDVWVVANFKETQLANIRPGQPVTIGVDALGLDVEGRVESIAPATGGKFSLLPAQNATGNFVKVVQRVPVRIAIEGAADPDRALRPGMSVVPVVHTR